MKNVKNTYIFLIRMYPVKAKGEHKAGAGFLTNYQPIPGANHIIKMRPKAEETWFLCKLT